MSSKSVKENDAVGSSVVSIQHAGAHPKSEGRAAFNN